MIFICKGRGKNVTDRVQHEQKRRERKALDRYGEHQIFQFGKGPTLVKNTVFFLKYCPLKSTHAF